MVSANRTYEHQQCLFNNPPSGLPVGRPGTSNHGWGKAVDITTGSAGQIWFKENCERFGWQWYGSSDPPHFSYKGGGIQ